MDKVSLILGLFEGVPAPLAVMGIAALPIAELRLAIPVALGVYGLSPLEAFGYSVLGNMIPVPFILLLFPKIKSLFAEAWPFRIVLVRIDTKVESQRVHFEKYGPPALMSFVAVPLPMTGAWTGAAAATIFGIRMDKALLSLTAGVMIAGAIVTFLTLAGIGVVHHGSAVVGVAGV